MNRKHLNSVIAKAMNACKRDTSGKARLAVIRLNHARDLLDRGYADAARNSVNLARVAIRYGV